MREEIHPLVLIMRILGLFLLLLGLVSCTTTVEDEFAEFEPLIRPQGKAAEEEKAMRMFGDYDPNKKSAFAGKEFRGKEANLRSSFEKKAYVDHPYYQLRKKGYFSDKKAFRTKSAREGSQVASWQNSENSWFKRVFSKRQSSDATREVARQDFRLPQAPRTFDSRSHYEKRDYPLKIIDDPDKDKKIARKDLRDLLN